MGSGVFADVARERSWNLRTRRFLPRPTAGRDGVERRFERRAAFTDPTAAADGYWEQTWVDVAPADLRWHEPLVRVEACDDDRTWTPAAGHGRPVDDQGWALEIVHRGETDGVHRYRVRWYDPVHRFGRRHRFVLVANAGRPEVAGEAFD